MIPAEGAIVAVLFGVFVALAATGALMAALSHRVIRGVCGLAICCFGLAGLYYFLRSPFIALMEILIYVGAVCVTIIFAVMLAEPEEPSRSRRRSADLLWGAFSLLVSAAVCVFLARLGLQQDWAPPAARLNAGTVQDLGVSLLTTYSLAFELISLVLLIAILGALAIARPGKTRP